MLVQPASTPQPAKREHKLPRTPRELWRELVSGELFEVGLHLSPTSIKTFVDTTRDLGESLKNAWSDVRNKVGQILNLPEVQSKLSPETRQRIEDAALTGATAVAYAAAGVQGLAGFYKIKSGMQLKSKARILDGGLDLATSAAIAATVAGLTTSALILGPLAAGLGVVRGSINGVAGFRRGDSHHEIQGLLDASRSASIFGRLLHEQSALLGTSGVVLGAVAGLIQVSRGYYDLSQGLKKEDRAQQVQGLTDVASAVGLSMAALSLGTIPGIVIAGLAVTTRVLYQLSPRAQKRTDRVMERLQPALTKSISVADRVVDPLLDRVVRPVITRITGWRRGDEAGKPEEEPPPAGSR